MKRAIEPSEIREGDLIRVEWVGIETAEEWRTDGTPVPYKGSNVQYYLLDRPTPAIKLPETPTLGWATWQPFGLSRVVTELAVWGRGDDEDPDGDFIRPADHVATRDEVTAFVPATAIPTAALDELRERARCYGPGSPTSDFLAAIKAQS